MALMDPDTLTAGVLERMRKRIDDQAYNYITGYKVMWSDNTGGLEYLERSDDALQRRIVEEYRRRYVEAEMRRQLERDQEPWTVPVKIKKPNKVAEPKPEPEPEPKPFGHRDLILD